MLSPSYVTPSLPRVGAEGGQGEGEGGTSLLSARSKPRVSDHALSF